MENLLLILSGIFYSVLCVFSIVTGLMYASGKKELNPLELSDKFVSSLKEQNKLKQFTRKMGWVTFIVGVVQGLTAYSLLNRNSPIFYWIAVGFTLFSIFSASVKLKKKINFFPMMKLVFYIAILIVLLLPGSRAYFF